MFSMVGCLFLLGKLALFSLYFWRVIIQSLILKRSDPHMMICCSWIYFWANLRVHVQSEVTWSEWDNNHLPLIWRLPLSGYHESGWFQVHEILITCHCRQDFLYIYDNFLSFYWNQCWLNQVILISNLTVSSQEWNASEHYWYTEQYCDWKERKENERKEQNMLVLIIQKQKCWSWDARVFMVFWSVP